MKKIPIMTHILKELKNISNSKKDISMSNI